MKRIFLIPFFAVISLYLIGQETIIIEGTTTNDRTLDFWQGVVIPKNVPQKLIYRNNSITAINASGYLLQAGDELVNASNNYLDGEVITGNVFTWNGTDLKSITHGVFTGYNINVQIKYNFLDKVPMGILRKSNGMTNTTGGVAYNIIKNPLVGIVVKGMNGVCIYNNTLYSAKTEAEAYRGLVEVYSNDIPVSASTGTKIKNNIFYTVNPIINISLEDIACVEKFESDYNVFWCENGVPKFNYLGLIKTFSQWQQLGYDLHSIVINPKFIDLQNFVPLTRLDYGTDLGSEWQAGLSTNSSWGKTDPETTNQNGIWQVGAYVFQSDLNVPEQGSNTIKLYPNPVIDGVLTFRMDNQTFKTFDLSIFNIDGKSVFHKYFLNTSVFTLDLSGYPSAQYLIQIHSGKFVFSHKIIKK